MDAWTRTRNASDPRRPRWAIGRAATPRTRTRVHRSCAARPHSHSHARAHAGAASVAGARAGSAVVTPRWRAPVWLVRTRGDARVAAPSCTAFVAAPHAMHSE
eukprot:scaffold855_cov344-Prasinococcus_capsulatus_cf.AAC.7